MSHYDKQREAQIESEKSFYDKSMDAARAYRKKQEADFYDRAAEATKKWAVDNQERVDKTKKAWNNLNHSVTCRQQIVAMLEEVSNDVMQVFDFGAKKHPDSGDTPNFLTPNGNKCSLKERGSSVLRHSARTFMRPEALDEESNLSELLHLMSSVAIMYIRHKRGLIHPEDIDNTDN